MTLYFTKQAQSRLSQRLDMLATVAKHAWLVGTILLFLAPFSFAQVSTAVLGGEVFDAQHKIIQNAVVTVTSDDTGVHWTAKTNEAGSWRVDALPVGRYHFDVTAPGFQTLNYGSFLLNIETQRFFDVVLNVGSTSSSITVQAVAPLIDTTSAVSGTVLTVQDMDELPNTDNAASGFAVFTPGTSYGGSGWGVWNQNQIDEPAQESQFWVNGLGGGAPNSGNGSGSTGGVNFVLDGTQNTTGGGFPYGGILSYNPPVDAVQEVRMTTNAYDASIGRTQTAALNETMKSGTKDFHGDLYEINENNFANANYYGAAEFGEYGPPIIRDNEYGGTVGGPVWIPKLYDGRKKKTYFFYSYDGIRSVSPSAIGTVSLPTALERQGDFSQSYTTTSVNGRPVIYPIQLFDPATAAANGGIRTPISSENISGKLTPEAEALNKLIPLPNHPSDGTSSDSNDYMINDPLINHFGEWSIRADQAWNNNNHSYVEYRNATTTTLSGDYFGPNNILSGLVTDQAYHGLTVSHAWVISPTLLLSVTVNGLTNLNAQYTPSARANSASYGYSSQLIGEQIIQSLPNINAVFPFAQNTDNWTNNYNLEGTAFLQQIWKVHTFHYGTDYLLQRESTGDHNCGAGCYNFSGIWTVQNPLASTQPVGYGSSWADWLLGSPATGNENNDATAYWSQPYMAYWVQDDWRVTPKLTLNLGIRWDYQLAMTERHNKYWSRYDPNVNLTDITNYIQPLYGAAVAASPLIQAYGPTTTNFIARGGVEYAGVNGVSRAVTDPEPNYWQPRIGFAYQIRPSTVLRGGYGRFVSSNFHVGNQLGFSATTPFVATTDDYITQNATLANPYPNGLVPATGSSQGIYTDAGSFSTFFTPNVKRAMTDDYSLHLQQQIKDFLFEIGGVYEHSSDLQAGTYLPGQCCDFGTMIGEPSIPAFEAAYGPKFDSTGAPLQTLPGDVQVPNPFYGAPYITNGLQARSTTSAYQLILPYPLQGSGYMQENFNGTSGHYALEALVQRHLKNGFFLNYTFHWGKQMDTLAWVTNPVYSQKLLRELSGNDQRFMHTVAVTYNLPFGKGQWLLGNSNSLLDSVVGGWELSGTYMMYSGPPIALPTNTAFWEGGDPGLGSKKSFTKWFNTSKFYPFPNESTTTAQLASYPTWTKVLSLPGAGFTPSSPSDPQQNGVYNDFHTWSTNNPVYFGDVRNPYFQSFNLGLRKSFKVWRETKLQLRMDALNALNHPIFQAYYSTNVSSQYFGYINGVPDNAGWQWNEPRVIELEGKLYF